jgi:hypothetical protein
MATGQMMNYQFLHSEHGCIVPDEEKNIWHIFSQGDIQVYLLPTGAWKIERRGLVVVMMPDKLFELALARDKTPNVELTGAARLYRAASSDRRERGGAPG